MKRLLTIALALVLALTLSACSGGDTQTGNNAQTSPSDIANPDSHSAPEATPTPDPTPEATPNDNGGDNGAPPVQAVESITIKGTEYSTSLTMLWLGIDPDGGGGIDLTNEDIEPLRHMTNLTELWLSTVGDNRVSDISPLTELSNLEILILESNNISDLSPLSKLTNLTRLSLAGNKTPISDVSALSGLTKLTYLDVGSNNQITDWSPVAHVETVIGKP